MRKFILLLFCLLFLFVTFTSCKSNEKSVNIKTVETAPFKTVRTVYGPKGANRRFFWDIVKTDGSIDSFEVKTNEKTVGSALAKTALISFEKNDKTDNEEITISGYELEKGMKWAFYIGGELSSDDPNETEIKNGTVYSFRQIKK